MNICQLFTLQLSDGLINYQLTIDDIVYELGTNQNMSCLYYKLINNPIIDFKSNIFSYQLPIIGQLFVGIEANENIDSVNYIFKNYTQSIKINAFIENGKYVPFKCSSIPLTLLETPVIIEIKYNKQPDSIIAYYGFLSPKYISQLHDKLIYEFETEKQNVKFICGLPYIEFSN